MDVTNVIINSDIKHNRIQKFSDHKMSLYRKEKLINLKKKKLIKLTSKILLSLHLTDLKNSVI